MSIVSRTSYISSRFSLVGLPPIASIPFAPAVASHRSDFPDDILSISPAAHAAVVQARQVAAGSPSSTVPPVPPPALVLASLAANNLRNWIDESDRTLAEHEAARHNEHLARIQLKALLIVTMADEDHPIIAGNVTFWVGEDGEVTSRLVTADSMGSLTPGEF